jgi:dihydropteroate synthase
LESKDKVFSLKKTLNLKGNLVELSTPLVMGIINVTPDSFFDGGFYVDEKKLLERVINLYKQGASIIDIGGYSSRPGASHISEEEEIKRVVNGINIVLKELPEAYISVDTFRSGVAKAAVEAGACMVNDISGGSLDEEMFKTVAKLGVPYVLMHMKGTPQNMKEFSTYENLLLEIIDYLQKKISILNNLGVKDIIIDPGFGFAKTIDQNYELLKNLNYFKALNKPLLIGLSRKSMIYKKLGVGPEDALNGTTVLNTIALLQGASILRVHDIKEAVEAIKLLKLTYN